MPAHPLVFSSLRPFPPAPTFVADATNVFLRVSAALPSPSKR